MFDKCCFIVVLKIYDLDDWERIDYGYLFLFLFWMRSVWIVMFVLYFFVFFGRRINVFVLVRDVIEFDLLRLIGDVIIFLFLW